MRTVVALVIASGLAAAAAADDRGLVTEGERWWAHVSVLASDAMAGRETASPGHKAAADYVAAEFKRAGLTPGGVDGSFIQPVKVRIAQIDEARSSLAIVRAAGDLVPLKLGEDATLAVRAGLAERLEADAVFCGYCLTIPEYQY